MNDTSTTTEATDKPWLFKPGNTLGRGGRPKGVSFSKVMRQELDNIHPKDPERRTHLKLIAQRVIQKAEQGDIHAAQFAIEQAFGKLPEKFDGEVTSTLSLELIRTIQSKAKLEVTSGAQED